MNERRVILCLGPHRSGTSTVAAAIAALGADLGFTSLYANDENQKGFFEHPDLIALNERVLGALGGAWDAPAFDGHSAIAAAGGVLDPLRDAALAFLQDNFGASNLVILKDPRLCVLLDFWFPILRSAGFDQVDCVHVLRDPVDAALSQQARVLKRPAYYEMGRTLTEGAALWLAYSGQMWDGFDQARHMVLSYDALIDAPDETLGHLAAFVGATANAAPLARFKARFLDAGLRHNTADQQTRAQVDSDLPQARAMFDGLAALAGKGPLLAADLAFVPKLLRDARPQLVAAQSSATARLSNAKRAVSAELSRLTDLLSEAEKAKMALNTASSESVTSIRVEAERANVALRKVTSASVKALKAELAKQKAAYVAELSKRDAVLSDFVTELAKRQSLIDDLIVQRDTARSDFVTELAKRQSLIDDLIVQRDTARSDFVTELAKRQSLIDDLIVQRDTHALKGETSDAALQSQLHQIHNTTRTVAALELELAGAQAQIVHDQLVFDRDLAQVRQSEAEAHAKLAALRASRSWRLTAPVRAAGVAARELGHKAGGLWVRFNHFAKRSYRAIAKQSPWLAEMLRRVIVPFIRAGNRAILRSDYVPTVPSHAAFAVGQTEFQFDYQRPQVMPAFNPLVTVLVPNYNHAPYLRQRLDSIFAQSWQNVEVILMDDCSSDDSRTILQDYADRYPDRVRVIFNEVNSGGAFYQWEKGLRAAKGDLIWVAESDDWCSPNFLETLVPFFANDAVQLAYAPTYFMNKDGTEQVWSMAEYLSDLGPDRWARAFVMTAPQIVREAFAEKNIIPNVSSAVFRRLDRLEVLENDVWRSMRTCGDWVFYLNQIRGGLIAYSPDAQNYYRLHPTNTSVGSFSKDSYYIEHETVAKTVQRHYGVDPTVFQRQHQNLILHWTRNRPSFVRAEFDACYSLARITAEAAKRKPKLLMAGYAFCSGGGETFPITLANVMKTAGYDITYLNCAQEPDIPGIRSQLARDIPVVTNFEDLNGILRDFDIDVIHSHHAWVDNTILDILPENSPVKTVITLHGMYETLPEDQLKRTLPRLVKRTGAMVYIAEKNISALVSRGLARAQDLPRIDNALALGPVTPVDRASLGISADAFVLTVVSRAIAPKGWSEAIAAVTRARDLSGKDVHLILVGDGPEYDRLLGHVPPYVHLEGFRSNTRDYFATADVGLLPSRFKGESFPLVIIDCLHAGRPVIASDLGEIPYMLTTPDGVAGAMFALEDWQVPVETLALQISDLARNRALLSAMTARVPEAAKRFDPVLMRDRYDQVYETVAKSDVSQQAAE